MRRFFAIALISIMALLPFAGTAQEITMSDSTPSPTNMVDSLAILRKAPVWLKKYLNSLIAGNVDRSREKIIDLSFGISPSYTREASFGIGAMCTALYRVDRNDTLKLPSDIFACLNVSLNGFYVLTVTGNNLFPDNRSRLSYRADIYNKRLDFWGITSEECAHNPATKYDRRSIALELEYVYRLKHNFYAGAHILSNYTDAKNLWKKEYLLGERPHYYVTGLGLSLEIDSRNSLVTPTRGIHVAYTAMFYPKFLGNAPYFFNSHTFVTNVYTELWRGAIAAFDLFGGFNSSKAPWTMREMLASDGRRMRGYYMGSYIDNSQIALQAELRQHIWRRLGVTAWIGGATIFSSLKDLKHKEITPQWLPNGGLGLRYEFKHNVNARIDFGIGRHTSGFVFAVGEAF